MSKSPNTPKENPKMSEIVGQDTFGTNLNALSRANRIDQRVTA